MFGKAVTLTLVVVLLGGVLALVGWRLMQSSAVGAEGDGPRAAPVEVGPIEHGLIQDRRTFSGTLTPRAQFIVAPKVSGRVVSLKVDIGDAVAPGAVVAELDDDEFEQAVAQAQAELEVARAQLAEARSALEIARREYERVQTLRERNIASESALDAARADLHAKEAQVQVAEAQVQRAEAVLGTERIRLGYTSVAATWSNGGEERVVSERYVDEGATVAANDPIVTVVDLSRVRAVLYVTEHDYARLRVGQPATIQTGAYPGETFEGEVLRLAPVFEEASRQARVEVDVPNPDRKLKAGMFVRVSVVLDEVQDATIVPGAALVRRQGRDGVFVVNPEGTRVSFVPVRVGIRSGDRVQVVGEGLAGRVVTLGQQLVEDGSPIRIPELAAGFVAGEALGG